ncbi:hypothetical protein Val02_04660 [Virgisporangium aliadipatigenens]|uniref:Uncharacterized protein n=1 Tax=Virgisporangium aliadipatigenens TaxID=741659 RepID=A0A8J3YGE2_9ACTN|nr:hypothetical protein [Virgisporangium aliadipatigenens]GIJ43580.1 hypothetical protein Val02_04660 [Virgisporangium aliadipatigenens]
MASIPGAVTVDLLAHPTDLNLLNVRVRYTITFTDFDVRSRLEYLECIQIFGIDQGAGEDGVDDLIADVSAAIIRAENAPTLFRDHTFAVSRDLLNEDQPPEPNPDELQARVTLTPMLPVETVRNSPTKVLNLI